MTDTLTPTDPTALAAAVKQACGDRVAVYPVGGGTSLDFGLPLKRPGVNLSLAKLTSIIDYPARDMTITVEAGVTMAKLAATLAEQGQRLPIDVPEPDRATLGGVIATNFSGPLRFGHGTIRDYVIGISAVDGRGSLFRGGGRVVKNVAGYDFCKLLTGSLGTIGVVTQVTLKVKPLPQATRLVACPVADFSHAERLLESLVQSRTTPAAIELISGPAWNDAGLPAVGNDQLGCLLIAFEGTAVEVDWMTSTLGAELRADAIEVTTLAPGNAEDVWRRLRDFPRGEAALVVKAVVPPSRTVTMAQLLLSAAPGCSIQAHTGNGVLIARYPDFPAGGLSRIVIGQMRPAATNAGGHLVILSANLPGEITRQAVWGGASAAGMLMAEVKRQFDPNNILNPGRFGFEAD